MIIMTRTALSFTFAFYCYCYYCELLNVFLQALQAVFSTGLLGAYYMVVQGLGSRV